MHRVPDLVLFVAVPRVTVRKPALPCSCCVASTRSPCMVAATCPGLESHCVQLYSHKSSRLPGPNHSPSWRLRFCAEMPVPLSRALKFRLFCMSLLRLYANSACPQDTA